MLKISQNPKKTIKKKPDEIVLLEKEYKEAIEKAKAEWNFTDKKVEELFVNKIRKKYSKLLKDLMNKYKYY